MRFTSKYFVLLLLIFPLVERIRERESESPTRVGATFVPGWVGLYCCCVRTSMKAGNPRELGYESGFCVSLALKLDSVEE